MSPTSLSPRSPAGRAAVALITLMVVEPALSQTAPYEDMDNVEGPMVLLNAAPIRPMAFDADGHLWAVNLPGNTVEEFVGGSSKPVTVHPVPWGPVSVAHYSSPGGGQEILVVTRNTWALTRLDAATGDVLDCVALDSEPGDILVDEDTDKAFVSCMGGDSVIQVDLTQYDGAYERRYHYSSHPSFLIKSPLFMSFDAQGRVLVAPLHSGNNSTTNGPDNPNSGNRVIDLYDPGNADGNDTLPDEDLFRIDPYQGPTGTVTPVARRMGSILFQHGVHDDGTFWQLHTEANNKFGASTMDTQSEPELRGRFAFNRITRVATPFGNPTIADPTTDTISLDPGAVFTTDTTVAQPFAMDFHTDGKVFITGVGSDNVVVLNADGSLFKEWDLPDGAIPRGVLVKASAVLIYCWGTHEIKTYRWANPGPPPLVTYKLGFDPTPDNIKQGREVFFDASNSMDKNLSCATCHVDGGSDLMQWNLSNMPKDDKGPMITQTLVGLDRLAPFHWRGEREFDDFNGAFDGLLGNDGPIDSALFDRMEEFLFALKNPANPFQNRERVVDSSIQYISNFPTPPNPVSDAVQGQIDFRNAMTFQGRFTCNRCHAQPTGTNNDTVNDFPGLSILERTHLKVAPFHELWRRQQRVIDISYYTQFGDPTSEVDRRRAFLGPGTSHSGGVADLFFFVQLVPGNPHITGFTHQWDNALAPVVHYCFRLNAASAAIAPAELQAYLEKQAVLRNCDIAAFGTAMVGGLPVTTRWFWDRYDSSGKPFKAEDPAIPDRSMADFIAAAANENHLFLGLPVGTSESFAVDYDRDGLKNAVDSNPFVPAPLDLSDNTPPTFKLGPDIPWVTTRTARIRFDTDELTTATVSYYPSGSPGLARTASSPVLGRSHALMLPGLRASSAMASPDGEFAAENVTYDVDVTINDRRGNPTTVSVSNVQTDPFILPNINFDPVGNENDRMLLHEHVVASLQMDPLTPVGNGANVSVTIATAFKQGAPHPKRANDRVIVGRILKVPAGQTLATVVPAADLTPGAGTMVVAEVELSQTPTQKELVDGPYIITTNLTLAGATSIDVDVANVATGDKLLFNIEAVVEIKDALIPTFQANVTGCQGNPGCRLTLPVDSNRAFSQWDFPATSEANTCVQREM